MKNPLNLQNLTPSEKNTKKKTIMQGLFLTFACAIIMFFPGLTLASGGDLIDIKPIVGWIVKGLAAMMALAGVGAGLSAGYKLINAKTNEETSEVPKAKGMLPWAIGALIFAIILWSNETNLSNFVQSIIDKVK